MLDTKLIVVEGIPGSGKSTTAGKIKEYLDIMNIPARLYLESDCDNPSDYAWVSVVTEDDYCKLITDYIEYRHVLKQYTEVNDGNVLVYYQKMKNDSGMQFPDGLMNFLSLHEPYDGKVPADVFCRLHLSRYNQFAERAKGQKEINIFESSYLQNQVNELLGHQKVSKSFII